MGTKSLKMHRTAGKCEVENIKTYKKMNQGSSLLVDHTIPASTTWEE